MTRLDVPASVGSADDLLPMARGLVDDEAEALAGHPGVEVSCRAGCAACCRQPVPVRPAEVRALRAAVAAMDAPARARVAERAAAVAAAVTTAVGEGRLRVDASSAPATQRFAAGYMALEAACPLLVDGCCSVRADRPLACREYLVTSDPQHCADPMGEAVVRVRGSHTALDGFGRVSAVLGEPDVAILALALAGPPPPAPVVAPRSGPRVASWLLSGPGDQGDPE